MLDRQAQIAHIKEHEAEFYDLMQGDERTVEDYFDEYSYIEDLYERLCSDLNLTPRGGS